LRRRWRESWRGAGEIGREKGCGGRNFAVMERIEEIVAENARRVRERERRSEPPVFEALEGEARRVRMCEDFEYWAATCVKIFHKNTRELVPFVLNGGQRNVLARLESQRRSGKPVRAIILKSRQWGCSTLCYLLIYLKNFY